MRIEYEVHVSAHPEQARVITGYPTCEAAQAAAAELDGVVVEREVLEL